MINNAVGPARVRLARIERWRRERFERAMQGAIFDAAKRAAVLYAEASARAIGIKLGKAYKYADD